MSEPTPNLPALAPRAELPAVSPRSLIDAVLSGRKATTLRSYSADYRDFANFLGAATPAVALEMLTSATQGQANGIAIAYRAYMADRGLSTATIARRLAALRTAVGVARTLGRISWSLDVESPAVETYRDCRGPGDDGWRAMLDVAKREAASGNPRALRDVSLIRLLHDVACRRAEAIALDVADYDRAAGTIAIIGKGRSQKTALTLPAPTRKALDEWLSARGDAPGPIYVRLDRGAGSTPERLTGESVRRIVRALGSRAGLTRPVRPHGLRHAGISTALDRCAGDVRRVQKFSRHRSISVVLRYDDARRDDAGAIAGLVADE